MEQPPATNVTATVQLRIAGHELSIEMRLPTRPTGPRELLPLYRGLVEHVMRAALAEAAAAGATVSCGPGCGACCRQAVPLAELEAWQIRELVDRLPEPRRTQVRARFAAAVRRLEQSGLRAELLAAQGTTLAERIRLGDRYFALGIPCPFLEQESCSIYEDRPLMCREYLVTSPPGHCVRPSPRTVRIVPVPRSVAVAVQWLTASPGAPHPVWVPLTLALAWAESHPEPAPTRTAPELVSELFERLTLEPVPPAPA